MYANFPTGNQAIGRKYLPFKVRAFIDLALESGCKHPEQTHLGLAANRARPVPQERVRPVAG